MENINGNGEKLNAEIDMEKEITPEMYIQDWVQRGYMTPSTAIEFLMRDIDFDEVKRRIAENLRSSNLDEQP